MTLSVAAKHGALRKRLSVKILADFDGSRDDAREFREAVRAELDEAVTRLAAKHDLRHMRTDAFDVECEG